MVLVIQEPGTSQLLQKINECADGALVAGAAFAFASKAGVNAFLSLPNIQSLIKNGVFELVIGIDAITNVDALYELRKFQEESNNNLTVKIFKGEPQKGSIFHPKFSWFVNGDSGWLITGSGNLTHAGLGCSANGVRGNWEAFSVNQLDDAGVIKIKETWEKWLTQSSQNNWLFRLGDKEVEEKAIENSRRMPVRVAPAADSAKVSGSVDALAKEVEGTEYFDDVQICEISKNRWRQADLGKIVIRDFFGFNVDSPKPDERVLIQHVNEDNSVDEPEERVPFKNNSKNYRIELGASGKFTYEVSPTDDRPVVLFVKIGALVFRYLLVMPSSVLYSDILNLLGAQQSRQNRPMRKVRIDIASLKSSCNNLPDNLFPCEVDTVEM